ncbi:hypothetical protein [Clostridium sp. 1001275B_160808_H3]|uniref:hypothetical protein n=1 Tax=Clostridium sp. 1001275B_160808_H3 TaxID=2787110 RepID=UPI001897D8BC|nr:hypothetical protein [Clostridium sp. 1001275B_160808_H3]
MNYNNSDYNYEDYFKIMSMNNENCSYTDYEQLDNNKYRDNLEEGLNNMNLDLKSSYTMNQNNERNINMFQGHQKNQYSQELMKSQENVKEILIKTAVLIISSNILILVL